VIVIIYSPPGEDSRQWDIEEDSWTIDEMVLLEKHFGAPRPEFFKAVNSGSVTARRLLLWIARLRQEPELSLGALGDLKVDYLYFGQTVEGDEGDAADAVADPKDTPSESAPEPAPSKSE